MTMIEKLRSIKAMEAANKARLRRAHLYRLEPGDKCWYEPMDGRTDGRLVKKWYNRETGLVVVYDWDGVIYDCYKEG